MKGDPVGGERPICDPLRREIDVEELTVETARHGRITPDGA
jgi:hypothetical protein